jgi:hypothetical protein
MYCACIWDPETEQVCRFYWVSTYRRAVRLKWKYERIVGEAFECFIETERSQSNYSHAAGYPN